jgi:hypothetical protein
MCCSDATENGFSITTGSILFAIGGFAGSFGFFVIIRRSP